MSAAPSHEAYVSKLLRRLVDAKFFASSEVNIADMPRFPTVPKGVYVGSEHEVQGGIIRLPPFLVFPIELDQVPDDRRVDVMSRWRPKRFPPYWVSDAFLSSVPASSLPRDSYLPIVLTFGEAACIAAQFPLLERCRVPYEKRLGMEAYFHPSLGRMTLDLQPYHGNQYFHTARLSWKGGRHYHGDHADLAYERVRLAALEAV